LDAGWTAQRGLRPIPNSGLILNYAQFRARQTA